MSYEILYGKQFIKLNSNGEIIPMILMGSNNVYDIDWRGRGKRSRSWQNFTYYNDGKLSERPETIIANLNNDLRKYIDEHPNDPEYKPENITAHWGYYASLVVGSGDCGGTSWDKYYSFFINGIKKAMSIEELAKLGIRPYFDSWTPEGRGGMPDVTYIETESQYFTELAKWQRWQSETDRSTFWLYFSPGYESVLRILNAGKIRKPKEHKQIEQDHFFVLQNNLGTLVRYTSRGYKYNYYGTSGTKQFRTETEATKYRQKLIDHNYHKADTWQVKRIEHSTVFAV